MPLPADWIVPDWPAPPGVQAVFTTRTGGRSTPPFDSFNLGEHVRDDPAAVAANRARLAAAIGPRPVFLQQVHGTEVVALDDHTPDGTVADACLSVQAGVACTIMVADCLPVLFTNTAGTVVAAAHAGWRGLAGAGAQPVDQGVLETSFAAFVKAVRQGDPRATSGRVAASMRVWLGPCIGPAAFEVGPEVREVFVAQQPEASEAFVGNGQGRFLANLPLLARLRLCRLGVTQVYGNDGSPAWCSVAQTSRFFSHRRDAARLGSTGRMAACIWRV